jgi:hypothetical protein
MSTIGKVSILGDTVRADEVFGPFLSPVHIALLHLLEGLTSDLLVRLP